MKRAVLHAYDIRRDSASLKENPSGFEALRGGSWVRREFSAYTVVNAPPGAAGALNVLGFKVEKGSVDAGERKQ